MGRVRPRVPVRVGAREYVMAVGRHRSGCHCATRLRRQARAGAMVAAMNRHRALPISLAIGEMICVATRLARFSGERRRNVL
jgi:hypothetical protein